MTAVRPPEPSEALLGDDAANLLDHSWHGVQDRIPVPAPTSWTAASAARTVRPQVLRSLQALCGHGRLANTGYMSILPVDQGIEHSAGASFAPNRPVSTRSASWNWPWRVAATRWPRPSACFPAAAESTPTGSLHRQDQPQRAADPSRTSSTRCSSAAWIGPGNWVPRPWAPPSTSAARRARVRSWRSPRPSSVPTNWHGHHPVVLPAQFRFQGGRCRLPHRRRPHRAGQPPGVTIDADIIKQKLPEVNGGYNALKGCGRRIKGLQRPFHGPSDRPVPLPGGELLHGPARPDPDSGGASSGPPTWPRPFVPP